ncbi:uncharacterized protein DNG_02406 [Cephalotrichum gorgonifer]|uniref:Uncharacterized protein n=1 Tax=Cephalotrichum gorgonifer TaxID=2041049 RepID=A0AAE8MUQ7_9PEZI|nr:uncharacterized protein DNG_02406 [Cephalotrichum gorgonifer]
MAAIDNKLVVREAFAHLAKRGTWPHDNPGVMVVFGIIFACIVGGLAYFIWSKVEKRKAAAAAKAAMSCREVDGKALGDIYDRVLEPAEVVDAREELAAAVGREHERFEAATALKCSARTQPSRSTSWTALEHQ